MGGRGFHGFDYYYFMRGRPLSLEHTLSFQTIQSEH